MWRKIVSWFVTNRRVMVITFEVFWILVFVLDRMTSGHSSAIPQFIYVNY